MGSAIAINFQPTGGGKCAITGDFVLTTTEVNPVIKALRGSGIEHEDPGMSAVEVTALHNHMLNDEPRLFFMHFWAKDQTEKLLSGSQVGTFPGKHVDDETTLTHNRLLAGAHMGSTLAHSR